MAIENNVSFQHNYEINNTLAPQEKRYIINTNVVDKTPDEDTVQLSTGLSSAQKVGIGAVVASGTLVLLGILGYKGHLGKGVQNFLNEIKNKGQNLVKNNKNQSSTTSSTSANDVVLTNKNKEHVAPINKKHRVKNTSVKESVGPITNAQEADIVTNIDTTRASSASRNLVEQHSNGIVTPEQQQVYDRATRHRPMTKKQKEAKAKLDAQNATQRAEANTVENNASGADKLKDVKTNLEKAELKAQGIKDGGHLNPANNMIYFTENGRVVRITSTTPNTKGEFDITNPVKIAKHMNKHNIDVTSFA